MLPWLIALLTLVVVILSTPTLGRYLFDVFDDRPQPIWDRWLNPLEQQLLRWIGERGTRVDSALGYAGALLISNVLFAGVGLLLLLKQPAWLNPLAWPGLRWDLALHTAISFVAGIFERRRGEVRLNSGGDGGGGFSRQLCEVQQ